MQICKFSLMALIIGCIGALAAADGMSVGSVSMGGITSPQMPTMDSPTIGTSFYMPGRNTVNSTSAENPAASGTAEAKSSSTAAASSKSVTAANLSAAAKSAKTLSASDLSQLGSMGLLSQLDVLLDGSDLLQDKSSNTTDILLQKVLTELEDIKTSTNTAAQATAQAPAASYTEPAAPQRVQQSGTPRPHLLRFKVNGYDILRTCSTIYISDVQTDGTFLVTGDRRYQSDGKVRNETFHMLFKTGAGSTSLMDYTAATAVTQDYYNPNSFMYQLTQHKNLSATRTGNLVTMRTDDEDWKLELLIDLGETK